MSDHLSEKSLNRTVEELKRLVAERGEPVAMRPTHMYLTGEGLAVAKRIMEERGMTTLEHLYDEMARSIRAKSDYERGFDDGTRMIAVHLAQRCRLAAQLRRRAYGTQHYTAAYAAWAECWNALQVAKRIYNENS